MKIALVHDWLDTWRGGESVLAEICRIYPDSDLYALVDFLGHADREKMGGRQAVTSFLQRVPFSRTHFRNLLPLFPRAIESLDVSHYDIVVSVSHAVAKGVRTHPGQLHLCYCLTPMRYAWDLQDQYLAQVGLIKGPRAWLARKMLARLRTWDRGVSAGVNDFIAISHYVADRIRRCYGRESIVIYPPVALPPDGPGETKPRDGAYVTVSQLVPYKRVDRIVEAFRSLPDRELIVIGEGPENDRIQAIAGANVRLLGRVPDHERNTWLARARAFVFAAEEDFGIAPLEAQAHGTPVIAFARGGSLETIRGLDDRSPTGVLFEEQTASSISQAIRTFEAQESRILPDACRDNAARFSLLRFNKEFDDLLQARWQAFERRIKP
jgi:glycosyltransferase involved in cell wall biosynthesis